MKDISFFWLDYPFRHTMFLFYCENQIIFVTDLWNPAKFTGPRYFSYNLQRSNLDVHIYIIFYITFMCIYIKVTSLIIIV